MKSYTDLEQSKKLAEILPIESADMHYNNVSIRGVNYVDDYRAELMDSNTATTLLSKYFVNPLFEVVPCWSLTALLGVIPKHIKNYNVLRNDISDNDFAIWYDDVSNGCVNETLPDITMESAVDACYEMIVKLKEQNLI